jgi:hypothetical protein
MLRLKSQCDGGKRWAFRKWLSLEGLSLWVESWVYKWAWGYWLAPFFLLSLSPCVFPLQRIQQQDTTLVTEIWPILDTEPLVTWFGASNFQNCEKINFCLLAQPFRAHPLLSDWWSFCWPWQVRCLDRVVYGLAGILVWYMHGGALTASSFPQDTLRSGASSWSGPGRVAWVRK